MPTRDILLGIQPASVLTGVPMDDLERACEVGSIPGHKNDAGEWFIPLHAVRELIPDKEILAKIDEIGEHPERGTPIDTGGVH